MKYKIRYVISEILETEIEASNEDEAKRNIVDSIEVELMMSKCDDLGYAIIDILEIEDK